MALVARVVDEVMAGDGGKTIAIGADHGGFELKEFLKTHLENRGIEVADMGCYSPESVDYPDIALAVARQVATGGAEKGILLCGTGIGISITANKVNGIRAALCHDHFTAKMSAAHNNANVLALAGKYTPEDKLEQLVRHMVAIGAHAHHASGVEHGLSAAARETLGE